MHGNLLCERCMSNAQGTEAELDGLKQEVLRCPSSSPADCALSALLRLRLPRLRPRFPVPASPTPNKPQGQRSTLQAAGQPCAVHRSSSWVLADLWRSLEDKLATGHHVPAGSGKRTAARSALLRLRCLSAKPGHTAQQVWPPAWPM